MTSIALVNAAIIDGTGSPSFQGSVLVEDDWIRAILRPGEPIGEHQQVIDLSGLTLVPGFIDVHSHADNAPLLAEDDTSKILQGVTTEVMGNCGFSLAPHQSPHDGLLEEYALRIFPELPWSWDSFGELFGLLDEHGYVTNYAPLAGHHALRIAAMGMQDRVAGGDDLRAMRLALEGAVDAGVFGLSTGLIYPPGVFADHNEIAALAGSMPDDMIYTTHMRGEGVQIFASIAEAVAVGETSGRRVEISHLKVAGSYNWGRMQEALDLIEQARERGVDVRHDIYPYTAGSTMLTACLPPWFQEGGNAGVLRRLNDPEALRALSEDINVISLQWENMVMGAGWEGIVVSSTRSHHFESLSLAQIAEELDIPPLAALVRVLVDEELHATMTVHQMSEEDIITALRHPLTMIGSDGLPPGTGGKPHPRTYGTFPRVLARYSRELGVLTAEEAVRRMTSLPASTFRISGRGVIAPAMKADLVAFELGVVEDTATFADPVRSPAGIPWVMINGEVVVTGGRYLGKRRGVRLSRAI